MTDAPRADTDAGARVRDWPLNPEYASRLTRQSYAPQRPIEGVRLIDLTVHSDDGGSFSELTRLTGDGRVEALPGFQVRQTSYSEMTPGAIKAWHLHERQDDLWFIPPSQRLLIGLLDVRANSPTCGVTMRFVAGAGRGRLVYIPAGVAHGAANLWPATASIFYFVSAQFDPNHPDELRLPWDHVGAEFWQVQHG